MGFKKGHIPHNKGVKGFSRSFGFQKGNKIWLGRKHKQSTKDKVRNAQKGLIHKPQQGFQIGHPDYNTEESINKIRIKLSGSNNYNWKGGQKLNVEIRHSFQYRQWRSDIFTKDDFICQICGIKGVLLNADHYPKTFSGIIKEYNITTFSEALNCDELWNLNNGRTLCVPCHKKTDTYLNNKNKK